MKRLLLSLTMLVMSVSVAFATAANPTNVQNGSANQTEPHGSAYFDGGLTVNGSIIQNALGAPAAPTFLQAGTAGSTSKTYYCVAQDVNGNESVPSASGTTTTSNATLSTTNFNRVFCGGVRGAVSYRALKADTSHSLGTCAASNSGGTCEVDDNSTSAGSAYTAIVTDSTGGFLFTQTAPVPLASLPTCAAATEGSRATATTCASVTLGTTCSGAGTTHANVYCNGTNWIETGY